MADMEVARLKEALYDQYMMMTELHAELEEEREASATAANEALAMILRLEREKAAEKMEANQYKRMIEERIHHMEVNMEELEEMEISFLRHQMQEYRQKFSVIGGYVLDVEEERDSGHEEEQPTFIRRNISLPNFRNIKLQHELGSIDMVNGTKDTKSEHVSCENTSSGNVFPDSNNTEISNPQLDFPKNEVYDVFEVPKTEATCSLLDAEPKIKRVRSSTESIIGPLEEHSNDVEPKTLNGGINVKPSSSFASNMDDLDQIKKRLAKLEREKDAKQEYIVVRSEQQFKILECISERLATIESQIKVAESPKKYPKQEDVAFASFIEAMLSFSI